MKQTNKMNMLLLTTTIILTLIGVIMVYSASQIWAEYKYNDKYYYFWRQLIFACLGFIGMLVVSKIDYLLYKKHASKIFFLTVFLLIAVLIPGIGIIRGGARSWIGIGSFSIQPSEFMKIASVILISKYLSDYYKDMKKPLPILLLLMIIIGVFGLIMLQPDFGTGLVLIATIIVMLFVSGVDISYFVYLLLVGLAGITVLIISAPYRLQRIFAYLDPWNDPLGSGFQIIQSLYAITPGGIFGVGFGNSIQKYFYLPEPQTDFIFAIIGEELGFIGALGIIFLFYFVAFRGMKIALNSFDPFATYVAIGIVAMIALQFIVNVSVVIGLIPVTGITLPLLSYGGSSLTLTLASIGILLNLSKFTTKI